MEPDEFRRVVSRIVGCGEGECGNDISKSNVEMMVNEVML
jgi:hypothetical protein